MNIKVVASVVSWLACAAFSANRPNIILFLVDDQGWYQTPLKMMDSVENAKSDFITAMPNMVRFAEGGMRFTQARSAAPVCGPSRAAIQTGKTPARLGFTDVSNFEPTSDKRPLAVPEPMVSLPEAEQTIAEVLKKIDPSCAAAHLGKWHCDDALKNLPWPEGRQGYDVHDGEFGNGAPGYYKDPNPKDMFGITDRAIGFMKKQVAAQRPFYLQVSHYALHNPPRSLNATLEKYEAAGMSKKQAEWAAVAENLDHAFGLLMKAVDELGLRENTYIFWASDNGIPQPEFGRTGDLPLRGTKLTLWEGGLRIPMFAQGPGIAPGSVSDVPVTGCDFLPTFCEIMGDLSAVPAQVDGGSMLTVLKNGGVGEVHRSGSGLLFHYPHYRGKYQSPSSAWVDGSWKLVREYEFGHDWLFNLDEDLKEQNDLSGSLPELCGKLGKRLESALKAVDAPMPSENPLYRK